MENILLLLFHLIPHLFIEQVLNNLQPQTQKTAYTTIIPGSFFTGSNIEYEKSRGIETDNADPSTLTIETEFNHGLTTSTSLYITNTVGKRSIGIASTSSNAPDGSPFVNTDK